MNIITDFKNINGKNIDQKFNSFEIISGDVTIGENGIYYAISIKFPKKDGKQN